MIIREHFAVTEGLDTSSTPAWRLNCRRPGRVGQARSSKAGWASLPVYRSGDEIQLAWESERQLFIFEKSSDPSSPARWRKAMVAQDRRTPESSVSETRGPFSLAALLDWAVEGWNSVRRRMRLCTWP